MKNFELENLSQLTQSEIQEMNGGFSGYGSTLDKSQYDAMVQANTMIIYFVGGLFFGLFDL